GRYMVASGSLKGDFAETTGFNSQSTCVLARCIVQNGIRRAHSIAVTPSAQGLLDHHQETVFTQAFGDSFVRGLLTGGEYYCCVIITSMNKEVQTSLAGTLKADFNALVASASFEGEVDRINSQTSAKTQFISIFFQRSGIGQESSPTLNIQDVISRFKNFPT